MHTHWDKANKAVAKKRYRLKLLCLLGMAALLTLGLVAEKTCMEGHMLSSLLILGCIVVFKIIEPNG